jgi:hypothetical protein
MEVRDEVLQSCKSKLGKETTTYRNIRDEMSYDDSIRIMYKIPIKTNSLGQATLLANPNYLISETINSMSTYSDYCHVTNVVIANHEKGTIGNWKKSKNIYTMANIPINFESYKFESGFIKINPDNDEVQIIQSPSSEQLTDGKIAFSTFQGKIINFYYDTYAVHTNKMNLNLLNLEDDYLRFVMDLDKRCVYKILPYTTTTSAYNRNGFNMVNEPPMILRKFDKIDDLIGLKLRDFSNRLLDNDEQELDNYNENIRAIDFFKKIESYTAQQIQIYNTTDEHNETVVRVDIMGTPFQTYEAIIELRYSIHLFESAKSYLGKKTRQFKIQKGTTDIKADVIKVAPAFSPIEKTISLIGTQIANVTRCMDYEMLKAVVFAAKDDLSYAQKLQFWDWIVDAISFVAEPLCDLVSDGIDALVEWICE